MPRQLHLLLIETLVVLVLALPLIRPHAATAAADTIFGTATPATIDSGDAKAVGSGPASARSNLVTPLAAAIAYPDLQVLMPTGEISIIHSSGKKLLEFTHITEDTGAGPLEIRPQFNPLTGISQGYQALYTMPSPGVWTFASTVPIVGPMIWTPPSDYNFPLDKFWLYKVASGGGVGSLVGTSPKDLFCMTSDTYVGGVPNTPNNNEYPGDPDCLEPEGKLGLSVGWGDQYDATDGGEGIPIASLPNGTYWLRGEVDPDHYLTESNTANNITDTKLQIEGDTVKVLEQIHPELPPPTVTLTSPAAEATLSGSVVLSATASSSAPISSVQFLLDGQPIGAPVTSPPYRIESPVGSIPPGKHFLSAQATDGNGFIGTAADVPVTVASRIGSVTIGNVVNQTGTTTTTTPAFSTSQAGEVLLVFADSDGPSAGAQTLNVSGAGLSWSLVKRANAQPGDAEIWTAKSTEALSNATVTATAADAGYSQSLTVVALSGATTVGSSASAGAPAGAPTVKLRATGVGSAAFATGNDWDNAVARKLGSGQELLTQTLEKVSGDTFWSQYAKAPSTRVGQTRTLKDTAPTGDHWNMSAVEVLPAAEQPDTEPPSASIVNPVAGDTVSGTTQVTANASDNVALRSVQFFLDGKALGAPVTKPPYAISWHTAEATNGGHTLTATATDTSGNVGSSKPVEVTVANPAEESPCFVRDVTTSVEGGRTVTTPAFTTAEPNEQLFAFVSADGPAGAGMQSTAVSGAGLEWKLVRRANSQSGDAEIWTATATKRLSARKVKSTLATKGYDQALTLISMEMSDGVGASVAGGAASGEPSVSLITTEDASLVFAVGNDWDSATTRVLGANQVLLHQDLDTASGKTFWSQYTGAITGSAGSVVTLNDTAPTNDQWNMAAVEILADGPGT